MLPVKGISTFGSYIMLMGRVMSLPERWRMFFKQYVKELSALGVDSIGIVLLISFPLYLSRTKLKNAITADIDKTFDSVAGESSSEASFKRQYIIYGLTCQNIKLVLSADIDKSTANSYYAKYCELRTAKRDGNNTGAVRMEIFTPDTIYHVTAEGVTEDVQETVVITESTAASETTK